MHRHTGCTLVCASMLAGILHEASYSLHNYGEVTVSRETFGEEGRHQGNRASASPFRSLGFAMQDCAPMSHNNRRRSGDIVRLIMRTGSVGSRCRISRRVSVPSISGMARSHKATFMRLRLRMASASRPDAAARATHRHEAMASHRDSRISGSSSTIRMQGLRFGDRFGIASSLFPLTGAESVRAYLPANILMRCARQPALNPLSIFTTPTPEAHELSMVRRGAMPVKLAP